MTDEIKGAGTELPETWPAHMVTCVIANAGDVESAVAELNEAGFPRSQITVVQGAEGAEALRNRGTERGRLNAIITRFIEYAGGIDDITDHAVELAEQGNHVVLVMIDDAADTEVDKVWQILKRHNGREGALLGKAGLNYQLS